MILIVGNGRSGTTWLGKIFDSHPSVVYRHEPDASSPTNKFPYFVEMDQYDEHLAAAKSYLQELRTIRTLRAVGRRPHFRKNYLGIGSRSLRSSVIWSLLLLGRIPPLSGLAERIKIPDLINPAYEPEYVIKSVASLGRAGLYSRAVPDGHVVFLLRHPCGVVASQLRGVKLGKLAQNRPLKTIAASNLGQQYGLTIDSLESLTEEEQMAWVWVIMNEQALAGLQGQPNVAITTHESLCRDPVEECKRLFESCSLAWDSQTEEFVCPEQRYARDPSYFDVRRNPADEIEKWKRELSPDVIERIQAILMRSPLAQYFS